MKLKEFDIVEKIPAEGIIRISDILYQGFKLDIFETIRDLLNKTYNTDFVITEHFADFNDNRIIYIKFSINRFSEPQIWISGSPSNYSQFHKDYVLEYNNYLKLRKGTATYLKLNCGKYNI